MSLRLLFSSRFRELRRVVLTTALVLAATGDLNAGLTIVASNPTIELLRGGAPTTKVSLQLANTSAVDVSPMVFFATIQILKGESAAGDVQISGVTVASNYVFRDATVTGIKQLTLQPEPPTFPTRAGTWFDAAEASADGVPIAGGQIAGLMDVELVVSADSQGDFYVVLAPFGEELDETSSWSDGANPGMPLAFENANVGSTIGQRTVARIDVMAVPEPTATIPILFSLATFARRRR